MFAEASSSLFISQAGNSSIQDPLAGAFSLASKCVRSSSDAGRPSASLSNDALCHAVENQSPFGMGHLRPSSETSSHSSLAPASIAHLSIFRAPPSISESLECRPQSVSLPTNNETPTGVASERCVELALAGERECRSGDRERGARLLEAALSSGVADLRLQSAIYCTLGNTYFTLHDLGRALLYHKCDLDVARCTLFHFHLLAGFACNTERRTDSCD